MISPIVSLNPVMFAQLIEPRRAVGIAAFLFALLHVLLVGAFYFGFNITKIITQFALIPCAIAFLIIVILTITSSNYAVRVLGNNNWKLLQRMNYIAFLLTFIHFIMKANGLSNLKQLNFAEVFLLLLAIIAIILRLIAFVKGIKK